jgi:hypothetical protein
MLNCYPSPNYDTVSQGGGEFLRELDAPQLCCGVLHYQRRTPKNEKVVIPAPFFNGVNSSGNPGKYWIPPYQVRDRLSQARNDRLDRTYAIAYNPQPNRP